MVSSACHNQGYIFRRMREGMRVHGEGPSMQWDGHLPPNSLIPGPIASPLRASFLPVHTMGTQTTLPLGGGHETKARGWVCCAL